jgi:hypothetical protein
VNPSVGIVHSMGRISSEQPPIIEANRPPAELKSPHQRFDRVIRYVPFRTGPTSDSSCATSGREPATSSFRAGAWSPVSTMVERRAPFSQLVPIALF